MSDDNRSRSELNRRKVMKSIGAAGGMAALPGLAAGDANAGMVDHADNDVAVVDAEVRTDDAVSSLTGSSATVAEEAAGSSLSGDNRPRPELQNMVDFMEDDAGLTAAKAVGDGRSAARVDHDAPGGYANVTIRFETDDAEFNGYDPAIDVVPFGTDTRSGSSDVSGSGLLFVYTVEEAGERVPVGTLGLARSELDSGDHRITSYVFDDGTPTRANSFVTSTSNLQLQGLWACSACTALVGAVCQYGMRVVGQYACVASCVGLFGANFIAVYGCASICTTMFNVISMVGCGAGATVICEEMTERTPGYINFC